METTEITKQLDESVLSVIGSKTLAGFEKAGKVAQAVSDLKKLLTDEYMKPIMNLQGNRLGFRTDKDKNGGYPAEVVKNCLIEAVLMGLQPTGNQFNIIAGNMYPTKEGCGYLLNRFPGLSYRIVCGLPKVNQEKTSAAVEVNITWKLNGEQKTEVVPIPIKIDSYASVDSIIGKATRKGRAWLLSVVSGVEVTDGEVEDANHRVLSTVVNHDPDDLQFLYETTDKELQKITAEEVAFIERVLNNKETQSYGKVHKILTR